MASDVESNSARADGVTLAEVREGLTGRWDCRAITAGFVGIPRLRGGTPIPRYGRTPAELLDNILRSEQPSPAGTPCWATPLR